MGKVQIEYTAEFVTALSEKVNLLEAKCEKLQYQRDKALEVMRLVGGCSACTHELDHVLACSCFVSKDDDFGCANFIPDFEKREKHRKAAGWRD